MGFSDSWNSLSKTKKKKKPPRILKTMLRVKLGWNERCMCAQLCPTLFNTKDCGPPGSSVQGISQARILEWVAISFSRGSSQPRDQTCISCVGGQILYHWATWEVRNTGDTQTNHEWTNENWTVRPGGAGRRAEAPGLVRQAGEGGVTQGAL